MIQDDPRKKKKFYRRKILGERIGSREPEEGCDGV